MASARNPGAALAREWTDATRRLPPAVILSGIMTVDQSYRAIGWTTVILVAALMPLSTAMEETGAAKLMATTLVDLVGDAGPYALLAGLFVLTAVLGQLISNTATALIVIPIGIAAAAGMGVSPRPVLMSTAVAGGAFLTPIATPTNLMVMGPGGYQFGEYWKLGLPLLIWFFIVSVAYVPLIGACAEGDRGSELIRTTFDPHSLSSVLASQLPKRFDAG